MQRNRRASIALVWVALAMSQSAFAIQILEGADGSTLFAKASNRETTRIALDNGRIASLRVQEGALHVETDEETGQVYISFPPGAKSTVAAWLTTDTGRTYSLQLQPTSMGQDSIVIKQPRPKPKPQSPRIADNYAKEIKRTFGYMTNDAKVPSDVEVQDVNETILLWKEARLELQRRYTTPSSISERFLLTNISSEPMRLQEHEFFKKGIRAVAIEQMNLMPGEATALFVLREKALHD